MPTARREVQVLLLLAAIAAPSAAQSHSAAPQSIVPPLEASLTDEDADWTLEWQDVYVTHFMSSATMQMTIYPSRVRVINYSDILTEVQSDRAILAWADGVILLAECDSDDVELGLIDHRLYLVRWGDREYVVPDSQMADFVEQIRTRKGSIAQVPAERPPPGTRLDNSRRSDMNLGPRFMWVPVRASDLQQNAFGTPELPEGWRAFLDHEPVDASITGVAAVPHANADDSPPAPQFDATINKGSDAHAFIGQELFWRGLMGHVVSAEPTSAVVRLSVPRAGVPFQINPGGIPAVGDTVAALKPATVKRIELPQGE